MKKVLLAFAVLCILPFAKISAQTFFVDSFTNQSLPGWTIVNDFAGSSAVVWEWSLDPSSAGGAAGTFNGAGAANGHIRVDSDNAGVDGTPESTTITSSRISCLGKPGVLLSFTEYYAKYLADEGKVYVSNDSVNWTLVHTSSDGLATNQESANPNFVTENISSIAANRDSVYIRFSWIGSYDYYWFVDDLSLTVPPVADVQADEVQNLLRVFAFDQGTPVLPGPCTYSSVLDSYTCAENSTAFLLDERLKPSPMPPKGIFGDPQLFVLEVGGR
ncbi:MAG: hypothetical protein NTY88_09420, partial [Bacteroidetes bacterium]|nr:hypothetical protein [Bacteroidota bacterium]